MHEQKLAQLKNRLMVTFGGNNESKSGLRSCKLKLFDSNCLEGTLAGEKAMPKYSTTQRNGVSDSGFVMPSELVLDQSPRTLLMNYYTDGEISLE